MDDLNVHLDPALVAALDTRFPEKCPSLKDSEREIFHYSGVRWFVGFLKEQLRRQSENILEKR